ncbi:polysaccharide biosynthesis protein [Mariniflexile fucanivorans]|uniref:Polysaccharide biosynthesis protein n=1 Tax=Mariniflexile fucanivorans TaxID=264023 RepID=A0A4R1RGE6_9FLAO|nr:SDR family NAD(P)-dependent oxidoreductase [Mariniflexile fucanivorans]TCL64999.1 polysaccharide biosynthesis protein [Mariniflexile fucanivorans]
MTQTTYSHIKQLIENSGVFHSNRNTKQAYQSFDFSNETILITGAAGSIGSELARHLLACEYKKLILIDIAESPLYDLIKEFENEDSNKLECLLININDVDSVEFLFENYKPTLIFHAAAYKHVPLMEVHPYEAVKTNVLATKRLADLAITYKVRKFIFISTDKAVNPISAMGMSKLIAENYIKQLAAKSGTQFAVTRFGNVIGSNGSVLLLFKKQMDAGVSLTITSKTVARYFIDNYKACNLILKIATFDELEGSLFTFNMGEPVKLIDLANYLIDQYGNDNSAKIEITALRPGEKNDEDIISADERLVPTPDKDILLVIQKNDNKRSEIDLSILLSVTPYLSPLEIKNILASYI